VKKGFKILGYIILVMATLLSLAIVGVYVFSKPIKNKVAQAISNQLAVPVNIKNIDLTVFKNFPLLSVSFSQIRVAESDTLTQQPLMQLGKFTLSLHPINLLRGKYIFEDIELQNGKIVAAIKGKRNNFSIFKNDTSASQQKIKLSFKKVTLTNIQLTFFDIKAKDTISLLVNNSQVSGKFSEDEFLVNIISKLVPLSVRVGGQKMALTKPINFQTSFTVNRPKNTYTFKQTKLKVENFNFIVNGKIARNKKATQYNLQILGSNLKLQQLLSLIPKKGIQNIENFESDGILECKVDIAGKWTKKSTPAIKASFKIADGRLGKKGIDVQMRNIALAGKLSYKTKKGITTSSLQLHRFSTIVNGEQVSGTLLLNNFESPTIKTNIKGALNLNQWGKLLELEKVDTLGGVATIDLEIEGKIADFKKTNKELPALFKGNLIAKNIKIALNGSPYTYSNISGKVFVSNNILDIDTLHGQINGNTIGIKGAARNLLSYLFGTGKKLEVQGDFYSPHIDIPSLTATNTPKNTDKKNTDTVGIVIPKNTAFKLKSKIDRLTFNKFTARNINGTVALGGGVLTLKNLDFNAMNGNFALTGNIFNKTKGQFVISVKLDANGVDINKLFYQCGNFGQQQLTADNIEGKLNAHLQLAAPMDKYLNINIKKLFVQSQIKIVGGRLYNYKPLLKLSNFINVNELKDISFERLENSIEIKDERITIPQMEIKNSALNLSIEGFHQFDDYMEYRFRLKLKEVLKKKFNRRKAKKENYEVDKEGINVFILMKGTPNNLIIKYDRKRAFKKFKKNIKEEKNTLLNLLRDEFNIKKKGKKSEAIKPKEQDENIPEWETDIPD